MFFVLLTTAFAAPSTDVEDPIEESIAIAYDWTHLEDAREVSGWTTARLEWLASDEDVEGDCGRRWARGWCGEGTFRTDDGGEGVAEFGVTREGRRRMRTVTLFYKGTGAAYFGEMRLRSLGALFDGVMDLAEDPAWVGDWVEPIPSVLDDEALVEKPARRRKRSAK